MQELFLAMAVLLGLEGIKALLATRRKEKMMIRDGGERLPTSSYVFLIIQYTFNILFSLLLYSVVGNRLGSDWKWVIFLISYVAVVYVSRFFEVLIRTLIVKYYIKKQTKEQLEAMKNPDTYSQMQSELEEQMAMFDEEKETM